MAKEAARKTILSLNGNVLAGVQTKSTAINKEPIDVTDDNSDGWRELLPEDGRKEVNLSVSGVTDDGTLYAASLVEGVLDDVTFTYPDGGTLEGSFKMTSYTEEFEQAGARSFSAEFQSSGQPTYTAPV